MITNVPPRGKEFENFEKEVARVMMNHFYILISWVQIYFCISDFAFLIYKYIVTTSSLCDDLNNSNVYKKYFHKYLQINIDII
jgi:hypothetical protein